MIFDIDKKPETQAEINHIRAILWSQAWEVMSCETKVTCPCGFKTTMNYAYRCFYCGVYFCRKCAERHFKKEVIQLDEPIDRKFTFVATSCEHGHEHSHMDAMVFLAKDKALPETLIFYRAECIRQGAKDEQIDGINLLLDRVNRYQAEHLELVKVADVAIPDVAGILDENEKP
jgi:hypothetical protein